jgi:hypothetical protein
MTRFALKMNEEEIKECLDQARAILGTIDILKDTFADAYQRRNLDGMNEPSLLLRNHLRRIANLFTYKERPNKEEGIKEWRHDSKITKLAIRLKSRVKTLDKDTSELNLANFKRHTEEAEKMALQLIKRAEKLRRLGEGEEESIIRKPVVVHTKMRDNFDEWKKWAREKKVTEGELPIDPDEDIFGEIDELLDQIDSK